MSALNWRRVHPLTPVMRAWGGIVGILGFIVWQAVDLETLTELPNQLAGRGWVVAGVIASLIAAISACSLVAWQFTAYALDTAPGGTGSVYFREGIVFRKQRQARLARIQAVDIKRSLGARLLGLSQLTCEVAGGSNSAVTIGYLREDDARALRAEILALAAQYRATEDGPPLLGPGSADGEPLLGGADQSLDGAAIQPLHAPVPAQPLFQVPTPRLLLSAALPLAVAFGFVVLVTVVGLLLAVNLGADIDDVAGSGTGEIHTFHQGAAALLFALAPIALIVLATTFQQVNRELDFQASLAPDGVRLKRGLLETRAQTIPPARIQAVAVSQRLLWRPFDWWRVTMTVAGYGREANNDTRSVLLPVGTRQEVFTALWAILPDLGTATPESLVNEGLVGAAARPAAIGGPAFVPSPTRARVLDPFGLRRRGLAVTDNAILIRSGWLHRRLVVVPRNRTQSVEAAQGPIQRRLGLATIHAHVPPGPVVPLAKHLDTSAAARVLAELTAAAR